MNDIVFPRRSIRSDSSWGRVDKLSYPFTGPWRIVASLQGASYDIEHCSTKKQEKQHTSDLYPYPSELLPLQPLDGADNQFGQINQKIIDDLFIQAGIKGFQPPSPFRVSANFLSTDTGECFRWPTLAELNEDFFPYPWSPDEEFSRMII